MFKKLFLIAAVLGVVGMVAGCASTPGSVPVGIAEIAMEEFRVPSDPGIQVYVRNKRPAGMTQFSAAKTVIFVHGATYPAETAFDLRLDGVSWMDYIAQRGYDVYLLDVRGYGLSTRPPQMDRSGPGCLNNNSRFISGLRAGYEW